MKSEEILTKRIQKNIKEKDWPRLAEALPVTEEYHVSKSLLYKGWVLLGWYYEQQEKLTEAIKAYNKARVIKPSVVMVFDKLLSSADSFFNKDRELFSKSDLQKFKAALLPIINYHSVNFPKQKSVVGTGERILNKIDYRMKFEAPDMAESPVTYQVQIIFDALYGDMTKAELTAEFARIIEDDIRKLYEKRKKTKKKKKPKKDK